MKLEAITQKRNNGGFLDFSTKKQLLKFSFFKKISNKNREEFYREFSTLIKSGVDYNKALTILSSQFKSKLMINVIQIVKDDVVKGKPLNISMKETGHFSPYEYQSIRIGEETRSLPNILDQLQQFYSRKIKMKRQIFSVMAYPGLVMIITLAVLYFMLNYVVPMFSSVFQQFGKELPAITKFVIELSTHFKLFLLLLILIIFLFYFAHRFLVNKKSYQKIWSNAILKIPFLGNLIEKIYVARFCQSMSLLMSSNTPLPTSIELTRKMISFYPINNSLKQIKKDILRGETFAESLSKHSIFSKKLVSLTKIGEQVNQLDDMFDKLAEQYDNDIEHSTKILGKILEPAMIVFIGSIVGFIMVAMYSPIFDLSKIIEN